MGIYRFRAKMHRQVYLLLTAIMQCHTHGFERVWGREQPFLYFLFKIVYSWPSAQVIHRVFYSYTLLPPPLWRIQCCTTRFGTYVVRVIQSTIGHSWDFASHHQIEAYGEFKNCKYFLLSWHLIWMPQQFKTNDALKILFMSKLK